MIHSLLAGLIFKWPHYLERSQLSFTQNWYPHRVLILWLEPKQVLLSPWLVHSSRILITEIEREKYVNGFCLCPFSCSWFVYFCYAILYHLYVVWHWNKNSIERMHSWENFSMEELKMACKYRLTGSIHTGRSEIETGRDEKFNIIHVEKQFSHS